MSKRISNEVKLITVKNIILNLSNFYLFNLYLILLMGGINFET